MTRHATEPFVESFVGDALDGYVAIPSSPPGIDDLLPGATLAQVISKVNDILAAALRPVGLVAVGGGGSGTSFVTGQTLGTSRSADNYRLGFGFTVGGSDITVVSLGRWVRTGNSGSHVIEIRDEASPYAVVATATLDTSGVPSGAFAYEDLGTPVVLTAGASYIIVCDAPVSEGDNWYDSDTILTTTGVATITGSVYENNPAGEIFFSQGNGAHSFGPVSFKYT